MLALTRVKQYLDCVVDRRGMESITTILKEQQ